MYQALFPRREGPGDEATYSYTAVLSLSGSMVAEDTDEEELVSVALKKNGGGESQT